MNTLVEQTKQKHSAFLAPESSYWRFIFMEENESVAFLDNSYPNHVPPREDFNQLLVRIKSFYDWIDTEYGNVEAFNAYLKDEYERGRAEERASERRPRPGYVYLMQAEDAFKIGRSRSPQRRVQEISKQVAKEVVLLHTIYTDDEEFLESQLHERFNHKRIAGEWFSLTSDDVQAIKGMTS